MRVGQVGEAGERPNRGSPPGLLMISSFDLKAFSSICASG